MYRLFIANKNYSSWSLRPWVLMRERGIPFQERLMPFSERGQAETFDAFSPSGMVPCLHDGNLAVWDSLAIAEYLAERHPGIWPADPAARAWARCAAAEMHSGFSELRERCTMNVGLRIRPETYTPALREDLARLGTLWSAGLERFGGPFLAGAAFTAVDAFYVPVALRVQTYGLTLPPQAQEYAARLLELDSIQEWQAAALAEPWREPGHEEEARRAGTWLEDRRVPCG